MKKIIFNTSSAVFLCLVISSVLFIGCPSKPGVAVSEIRLDSTVRVLTVTALKVTDNNFLDTVNHAVVNFAEADVEKMRDIRAFVADRAYYNNGQVYIHPVIGVKVTFKTNSDCGHLWYNDAKTDTNGNATVRFMPRFDIKHSCETTITATDEKNKSGSCTF